MEAGIRTLAAAMTSDFERAGRPGKTEAKRAKMHQRNFSIPILALMLITVPVTAFACSWQEEDVCPECCGGGGGSDPDDRPVFHPPPPAPTAEDLRREAMGRAMDANNRGAEYAKRGDWATAATLYRQALAEDPEDDPYNSMMTGNLQGAEWHLKYDRSVQAKAQGMKYWDKGDWEKAAASLRQALADAPADDSSFRDSLEKSLHVAERQGRLKAAIKLYDQGTKYEKERKWGNAEAIYKRALAELPDDSWRDEIQGRLLGLERSRQDEVAANDVHEKLKILADSMHDGNAAPAGESAGLPFIDPPPPPPDAAGDEPSDKRRTKGALGANVARPDLKERPVNATPGTDTKASDQLKTAGAIAETDRDFTKLYDGGTAKQAGAITFPTVSGAPVVPAAMQNNPRIKTLEQGREDARKEIKALDEQLKKLNPQTDSVEMAKVAQKKSVIEHKVHYLNFKIADELNDPSVDTKATSGKDGK